MRRGHTASGREPTMMDVAGQAGVSVATVSNTLNRPEVVSEATRARVQAAIEQLGFVRNSTARSLKLGVVNTVGMVLVDLGNSFFVDIARGAERQTRHHGLSLMIANADIDLDRQNHYLSLFDEARVSGVLLAPLDASLAKAGSARKGGRPVVLVNYAARGYCGVTTDEELGGYLAARHVITAGRKRLAFVGGPLDLGAIEGRLRGTRRAVAEAGGGVTLEHLSTQNLSASEGRRVAGQVARMPKRRRFDALVTAADTLAMACLQELSTEHGLDVPHDIAVTGYDDNHFASEGPIPLTTVRQPGQAMGQAATELLLEELQSGRSHRHRTVVLQPELIARRSSIGS